jgi:hypothetical protein
MTNTEAVSMVARLVALPAANHVVGSIIKDNVPARNILERVLRGYGRMMVTLIIVEKAQPVLDGIIKQAAQEISKMTITWTPSEG